MIDSSDTLEDRLNKEPSIIALNNKIKYHQDKLEELKNIEDEPMPKKDIGIFVVICIFISAIMYFSEKAEIFIFLYPLLGMALACLIMGILKLRK
tara:strand:- start:136 stop:420 length:285 start_codon:yes stop_codon:yes gene_type:complete